MNDTIIYALLLTLFAGLATGVGSAIAFLAKQTNTKFLSYSLGFSAGVMIYISFSELFATSSQEICEIVGNERTGNLIAVAALFGGMVIAGVIDRMIPEVDNPHGLHSVEEIADRDNNRPSEHSRALKRVGIMSAISIAIHNFPEGIATFMTSVNSLEVGAAIAIAVAIHNIPEGIAVSVPIYYATGSKRKAFWYSLLSGMAEPVGALVAYALLMPLLSPMLISCTLAAVAGIMIYIAFDELLPAAHQYGENHIAIYGLTSGMAVMAVSLILLLN